MKRTFDFGKIDFDENGHKDNLVTVEMEYKEDGEKKRFSVSAMVWNARRNDCICGGQCLDELVPFFSDNATFCEIYRLWKAYHLNDMHPECEHQAAQGWRKIAVEKVNLYNWTMTQEAIKKQCEAEKAAMSALKNGETFTPTKEQAFFASLKYSIKTEAEFLPEPLAPYYQPKKDGHIEVKALGWLKPEKHSRGILCKPCPVCGYKYGSAWNYFPIPEEDEKIIYKLLNGNF